MDLDTLVHSIRATPLSNWINSTTWIWPLCESVHFIGLSLLLGIVGFFDLRLMGAFKRVSVSAARGLMPVAIVGFLLNLASGFIFLMGLPEQYAHNRMWWFKVAFLVVAGVNAIAFETTFAKKSLAWGSGVDTPAGAKFAGALSLFAWLAVLYCGRMLPFLGDAF